jgi:hypothetical protein
MSGADRGPAVAGISNLLDLAESGIPADIIAPKVRERQTALAKVEAQLRVPRHAPPNLAQRRAALEQRAATWKAELRAEPKVARLLLQRLVGPITLTDPEDVSALLGMGGVGDACAAGRARPTWYVPNGSGPRPAGPAERASGGNYATPRPRCVVALAARGERPPESL